MIVLVVVIVPGLASAQGFGGLVPPGLPPYGPPGGALPAYNAQTAVQDSLLTMYVGWLEHYNGLGYSGITSDWAEAADQPLAGVWLGADLNVLLNPRTRCGISCGWLFPLDRDLVLQSFAGQHWQYDPDTQWGTLDGHASYDFSSWGEVIVGFRWDHFTTRWQYVGDPDTDYYNFKLNAFLPYFGLQSRYALPNIQLMARIIGFPWAPGTVKYDYQYPGFPYAEVSTQGYDKGHFLEGVFECAYQAFDNTSVGAFVSYNVLHFAATGEVTESPLGVVDRLDLSFDRKAWTLGGSVSVDFDLF